MVSGPLKTGTAKVLSDDGRCITEVSFIGCGSDLEGRVAFYRDAGHAFVAWTESRQVFAVGERFDARMSKLRTTWWDNW